MPTKVVANILYCYQLMGDKKQLDGNDYAVAHAFNNCVLGFIVMIALEDTIGTPEGNDFHELNRAYVLVVNELERLYDRNPELVAIKPEPVWKRFDVLKTNAWDINEYLDDPNNDAGQAHNARVERLMILANVDKPIFTTKQQELLDHAIKVRKRYSGLLDVLNKKQNTEKLDDWQIPNYSLLYKSDGTILINNVLKLKKAHAGSATERLFEQATKNPNTLFIPDLGQTSRNLSTILSSTGITPSLRQLFFPTVSKSKGLVFRPTITRQQADDEKIDTSELDLKLKELGAVTEPKSHK